MTFLAPAYLWFLLLLIPLTAIYLLKVKPEQRFTPALFLWHKLVEEKQTSALFRQLRDWISLVMLFLAVTAIIMTMARPVLSTASTNRNLLLVIDNSASMAAQDHGTSRLQQAKKIASNIIRNLSNSRQIIIATVAGEFTVVVNATGNRRELYNGINKITVSDMPLNPAALTFLHKSQNFLTGSRTLLLSDGCFSNAAKLTGIELLKIGQPVKNGGITAFDLVRLPGGNHRLGLYFQLSSSYPKPIETDLIISSGNVANIVKVCPVKLFPGINKAETYIIDDAPDGKWFAKLDLHDALTKDNLAPGFVSQNPPIQVMVTGTREMSFFTMCVEAFKRGNNKLKLTTNKSDVVLASGNIPPESSANKFIIFKPEGKSPFWKLNNSTKQQDLAQVKTPEHPAIKFCNIDGTEFSGIRNITPPQGSLVLCQTLNKNIPLIYKTASAGQSAYIINFDPFKSDFFLNINFPIMINAMIFDLTGENSTPRSVYHTGAKLDLNTPQVSTEMTFSSPENPTATIKLPPTTTAMQRIGFYAYQTSSRQQTYAAALLSQPDSLLDNGKIRSTAKPLASGIPLGYYLLIFALLIIVIESLLYHRGKIG